MLENKIQSNGVQAGCNHVNCIYCRHRDTINTIAPSCVTMDMMGLKATSDSIIDFCMFSTVRFVQVVVPAKNDCD